MFYGNPNTGDTTNVLVWIIIAIIAVAIIVTLLILFAKRRKDGNGNDAASDIEKKKNVLEENLEDIKAGSSHKAQSLETKISEARKSASDAAEDIKKDIEDNIKKD